MTDFLGFLEKVQKDELPNLATASKSRVYNKEWMDAIELKNMVHLLKAAALSALNRTESRGVHYREDYPFTDNDNWLQESSVQSGTGLLEGQSAPGRHHGADPAKGQGAVSGDDEKDDAIPFEYRRTPLNQQRIGQRA